MNESAPSIVYFGLVALAVLSLVYVQRLATLGAALVTGSPAAVAAALLAMRQTWGIGTDAAVGVAAAMQALALAIFFCGSAGREPSNVGRGKVRDAVRPRPRARALE